MIQKKTIKQYRSKRVARIRAVVRGTGMRPRLVLFRSHRHMYGQLVDDGSHHTIGTVHADGTNMQTGAALGESLSALCKKAKITCIVFDRSGYTYHGVVKKIADTLREGGIVV